MRDLLRLAAQRAADYRESLAGRGVAPSKEALSRLSGFEEPLPGEATDAEQVFELLDDLGSPATVATAGPRFFGFVIGGSLPAALAANWLAGAWDQNAALDIASPVAAQLERVALDWLLDVLQLPNGTAGGFVTGGTMANFTALAAARHALLERQGWDVESQGLFDAPQLTVVVSEEAHVSLFKALGLLGLGRDRVIRVPVDEQGRMLVDSLPAFDDTTIVCTQAGDVNSGAFDPIKEVCERARSAGAWVHVDGAFGLWAAATPTRRHLVDGASLADSWATDAHKWLNVPYDSGLVFCRNPAFLRAAMSTSAAYLTTGESREPGHYVPELSRRARGVEVWAALRSLGRNGLAEMIERACRHAQRFAEGLAKAGFPVLNEVVLNQVLVSFGDAETTSAVIKGLQEDGTCWCGGTVWRGQAAMRISVSSWATTEQDVEASLDAMLRIANRHVGDRQKRPQS